MEHDGCTRGTLEGGGDVSLSVIFCDRLRSVVCIVYPEPSEDDAERFLLIFSLN